MSLKVTARSYFAEPDHAITLILPRDGGHPVQVLVNGRRIDADLS